MQIISGLWLAAHYNCDVTVAFLRVDFIMRETSLGWRFRAFHRNGARIFFVFLYLHIARGLYYRSFNFSHVWLIGRDLVNRIDMDFRQMKKGQPFERRYHGYNFTKSEVNPKFYVRIEHTEPKVNESTMGMNDWLDVILAFDIGVVLLIIAIIFCICCLSFKCRSNMKSKNKKMMIRNNILEGIWNLIVLKS